MTLTTAFPSTCRERLLATWRTPFSFTTLVPVRSTSEEALRGLLEKLAPAINDAVSTMDDLHSFRIVVVPAGVAGVESTQLLLNLVHDRALDVHLGSLVKTAGTVLAEVFAATDLVNGQAGLVDLWCENRLRENTVHLGAIGRTLSDIRQEQRLRDEIGLFADRQLAEGIWNSATSAETVRRQTREHIRSLATSSSLPTGSAPTLSLEGRTARFVDLLKTFAFFPVIGVLWTDIADAIRRISEPARRALTWIAYGVWWIYGAIPSGLSLALVRVLELIEPDVELPPADPGKVERLENHEDLSPKNEVTYWFTVRKTWIRRALLAVILYGSERGCRHFWTDGKLAGIDTIHYARIMRIAGSHGMLFMSDYDGSLDRYLLDFTGVGSRAVIPIASNVFGSPKTRWLYGEKDPATFGPRLRNLLRTYQLEPSIWYSAYPLLTVRDILINGAIREGLFAEAMGEADAQRWADLL